MSAWPEAYYIINQLSNQFDLSNRVLRLENRIIVFAKTKTGVREPDLTDITTPGITFREGSLWFVEKDVQQGSHQIYALSIYSEQTGHVGWSDFHILSVDVNNISFTPTSDILVGITDIGTAINYLADQLGSEAGMQNASTTEAGIVQIGNNINVQNGLISVNDATTSQKGVVQLVNSATGTSTDRAITQKAVNDALANKITSTQAGELIDSAIQDADFLSSISIGNQTLSKQNNAINLSTLKTDLQLGTAAAKDVAISVNNTSNLITAEAVKTVTDSLTNKTSSTILTVSSSGWSNSATEIGGVSLYSKSINNITVHDNNPIIGIGAPTSRNPQIPTKAEVEAFSLIYAAVANNNSITFYATETPTTDFYVLVKGVN